MSTSGDWPVAWKYASGVIPRFASERTNPFEELPGARLDERAGALHVGGADELVDRRRAEGASIRSSSATRIRPSMSPRRSASVSNSLAERASSSSTSGNTFSLTCLTVTSTVVSYPSPSS